MNMERINEHVAVRLEEVARILETQGANRFRVSAYDRAAQTVRLLAEPVPELIAREGMEGLRKLKGIGDSLARSIYQLSQTGKLPMLERLRGESDPVVLLATVPGIGRKLAERIYEDLGIHTLEELEAAAHDGRLSVIESLGKKRIAGICDSLATRLGRIRRDEIPGPAADPPVEDILSVDREYRDGAARGTHPTIAPKRFNPSGEAWLPVFHTQKGSHHYTALYSNTALAHRLNRTHDWVVIYYDSGRGERQCTVVTAYQGELQGQRVVRGREDDCAELYRRHAAAQAR